MNQPELNQATFLDELGLQVGKFEKRVLKDRSFSQLLIWVDMLRCVWRDSIRERDEKAKIQRKAYEQLMLAEIALAEIEPCEGRAKALEFIGSAKGFLACFALGLLCLGIACDDTEYARIKTRTAKKVREELFLA